MVTPPPSDLTQYRITFFFGPEPVESAPGHLRCVFNVKKRSWKGGVQIAVDVALNHLAEIRERIAFDAWTKELLQNIEQEDRDGVTSRADDLFVQTLCACKLNLALEAGLVQENQTIGVDSFKSELDHTIDERPGQVTDRIRLELDLEETSDI